jgi:ATP:corrinoid adenosyltransferase
MSVFEQGSGARSASVDWTDLAGLDQVVKVYSDGENSVIAELADGRQVRITALRDLSSGTFVAEFEKRTAVQTGARALHVWAQTPAYKRVIADDLQSCLEAALLEVDRIHVY